MLQSAANLLMAMLAGGKHTLIFSVACPCCGARKNHRAYAFPRFFRPLPLAQLASSATGSARIAPPRQATLCSNDHIKGIVAKKCRTTGSRQGELCVGHNEKRGRGNRPLLFVMLNRLPCRPAGCGSSPAWRPAPEVRACSAPGHLRPR